MLSRTSLLALCTVALLVSCGKVAADEGGAEEEVDESDVLVLTDKNFDQAIKDNKYILVEFYAPWCGHCQHLKPEYARAATALKSEDLPVVLAKCDATQYESLQSKFDVQGFPTMKWFVDGEVTDFEIHTRSEQEIVRWVAKHVGPAAKPLHSSDELTAATAKAGFIAVGFFDFLKGEEYEAFMAVAAKDDKNEFFTVTDEAVTNAEGVEVRPKVVFYRTFDEPKVVYQGVLEVEPLTIAVGANSRPKVIEMTEETAQQIFDNELPKLLLFKAEGDVKESFVKLAHDEAWAGRYIFATVGEQGDPELGNFLGVDAKIPDAELFLFDVRDGSKYRLAAPVTADSMLEHIKGFEAGTLKPFLKSAPVIDGWDAEPVKAIVASQWEDFTKQDAHVVIEFYAPWCGHCQALEPKWTKAAEYFENKYEGDVVLAKMDATENEVDGIQVRGFPTVLVLAKGKKEEAPQEMDGENLTDTAKIVKTLKKMLELEDKKRPGEEEYQAAAKRFKNAVKLLKKTLVPAADALNKASETLEALAGKDEL